MFNLCSKMKWAHLPIDGGMYDQDPELLRRFEIIFSEIDKQDRSERDKREQEQKRMAAKQPRGKGMSRGGRRR
jgi:hypothetical protein